MFCFSQLFPSHLTSSKYSLVLALPPSPGSYHVTPHVFMSLHPLDTLGALPGRQWQGRGAMPATAHQAPEMMVGENVGRG